MIIAVDGPAAAGKGTLARALADALDYAYLDTGAIYRALARKGLDVGLSDGDEDKLVALAATLSLEDLEGPGLRGEGVGDLASRIAARPAVRAALLALQRRFAHAPPGGKAGAVLDGRDIGTVVCPDAELKLFITASPEARALRRHKELIARQEPSIYARVEEEMRERDRRDSTRSVAPLKPADDAVILDTSEMTAEAVLAAALAVVSAWRSNTPA